MKSQNNTPSGFTLNCRGRLLTIDSPVVMGILNITPDSFFAASRFTGLEEIKKRAEKMLAAGAVFLDIGGQSTRPGSGIAGADEERSRVIPAIEAVHHSFPEALISVDTYYSAVAHAAVQAGAVIVNDISGGTADPLMLETVGSLHVPYICMHLRGTPETMHQPVVYDDIMIELIDYFSRRLEQCRLAGIHDVIIDPGFGFSKNAAQNLQVLKQLATLKILARPILAGISRKATIYKTLGTTADQALNGTTVLNTISLLNGASILRVHDVKEAVEAVKLVQAYKG